MFLKKLSLSIAVLSAFIYFPSAVNGDDKEKVSFSSSGRSEVVNSSWHEKFNVDENKIIDLTGKNSSDATAPVPVFASPVTLMKTIAPMALDTAPQAATTSQPLNTSTPTVLPEPDLDDDAWPGWSFTNSAGSSYNVKFRVTNSPAGSDWDNDLYSDNHAMYMGDPYERDFESGWSRNVASVRSPEIIVPQSGNVTISWRDWHKIEDYGGGYWDECRFNVHDLDTGNYYLLTNWFGYAPGSPYQPYWENYTFDISQVAGHRIQIYLTFDTKDGAFNRVDVFGQRVYGWFVDDLLVEADGKIIYNEPFGAGAKAGRDIKLIETVSTANDLSIDFSSMLYSPFSTTVDENGNTVLEWNFPEIKINEEINISFDIDLNNLIANETREVSKDTVLSYLNVDGFNVTESLGSRSVNVKVPIELNVEVEHDLYGVNQDANIDVDMILGDNALTGISEQSEWQSGELADTSADFSSGKLTLKVTQEYPEVNLFPNGNFENASTNGWSSSNISMYTDSSSPLDGVYSLRMTMWGGIGYAYKDITIAADAYSAELSLLDRKVSGGNSDEYKIEIKNNSNTLLKTLYQSFDQSWPLASRNFDLIEFAGQTVRVYIFHKAYYGMNFQLDNISLKVKRYEFAPAGTGRFVIDAGLPVSWGKIIYQGETPDGTAIGFKVRGANSEYDLGEAEFTNELPLNDQTATVTVDSSRFLEIEVVMNTEELKSTPILDQLKVTYFKASPEDELKLKVVVKDVNGNNVKEITNVDILPENGRNQHLDLVFNTATNTPGNYSAVGTVYMLGEPVVDNSDAFGIVEDVPGLNISGRISTDKLEYIIEETAIITSKVNNNSKNLPLNNISVKVEIFDAGNTLVNTFDYNIPNLLIQSIHEKKLYQQLSAILPGSYTVRQSVYLDSQEVFVNETDFEVVESIIVGKGIVGTLSAEPPIVKRGSGSIDFGITAENTGNVDLDDVTLKVDVYDPETFDILKSFTQHISLTINGGSYSGVFDYDNLTLMPKSYPVAYNASIAHNGETIVIPLDINGFTVTNDAPIAVAGADQSLEGTSLFGNEITLDGSASTDANSTNPPAMDNDIVSYVWKEGTAVLGAGKTLDHIFLWGSHTVSLTVTDSIGAIDTNEVVINILDTTAPTITTLTPAHETKTTDNTPAISAVLSDSCSGIDSDTISLKIDGDVVTSVYNNTTGLVSGTPAPLTDGEHAIVLSVKDKAGNQTTTPEWTITVDVTPPVIADMIPANGSITPNNKPEISVVISDATTGIDQTTIILKVDGIVVAAAFDVATGKVAYIPTTDLADGWHDIVLTVKDNIGNQGTSPEWKFGVDTTAPVIANLAPVTNTIGSNAQPEISAVVSDTFSGINAGTIILTVDGDAVTSAFDSATGKVTYIPAAALADGWHNITLVVSDNVANTSTTGEWKIGVDSTPPTITNLTPAQGSIVNENQPEISAILADTFSGIDVDTITLKINGELVPLVYDAATGKVTGTPAVQLPDGQYEIVLTVKDNVGNLATSAGWQITIQTYLIFHNATSGKLDITGSDKTVNGRVHSNADIRIGGSNNDIAQMTTAVGNITIQGSQHDIPEKQDHAPAQPMPVYDMNYYKTNATYTHNGNLHIKKASDLPAGIHYVEGTVKITCNSISANVTIVSSGDMHITGKAPNLTSADDENYLVLFSGGDIKLSGNNAIIKGIIYAPNGDCQITSSGDTIEGAVIADTVDISGSGITFNPRVVE